ncbi:MAG: DNA-binding transcriptional LysR family regulator [Crocinitomicaceae bacterium]|jgi:DNA-binding transcriptional LysR family regulator
MSLLHNFDLNLLITFEALISECHVSRAAQKVFLSQSAMSHALNRLREHLDDPLLVRTEKGLQPTQKALTMLPQVRKALEVIERVIQPEQHFHPAISSRIFHIACTDYFEAVVLPNFVQYIQKIAPKIKIEVQMISADGSKDELEQRKADIVVGLDKNQILPSHLISEKWLTEDVVCLCSNNHPNYGDKLTLKEYETASHVVFSDVTSNTSHPIDDWLAKKGKARQHIARTMNYTAAASIVTRTDSIMTLPYRMGLMFTHMLPVKLLQPPKNIPNIEMKIVTHPLFDNDPAIVWLKHELKSVIAIS